MKNLPVKMDSITRSFKPMETSSCTLQTINPSGRQTRMGPRLVSLTSTLLCKETEISFFTILSILETTKDRFGIVRLSEKTPNQSLRCKMTETLSFMEANLLVIFYGLQTQAKLPGTLNQKQLSINRFQAVLASPCQVRTGEVSGKDTLSTAKLM